MDVSRPQNPCSRAGGSSIFKKSVFSTLSSKKVSRSVLGAPQNVLEGSLGTPGDIPKTPPEQAQAPPQVPSAADRRPRRLHRGFCRRGGSISAPYGSSFRTIAGLKGRLYGECRGSPHDYSEGIQDDDSENTGGRRVEHGTCHLLVRPLRAQRPEQGQSPRRQRQRQ